MIDLICAILTLVAVVSGLWGLGSAMMNGTQYSSLGPCLLVAIVCGLGVATLYQVFPP